MKVLVLIGPSGAGKSTWAAGQKASSVSADRFFMKNGRYEWDQSKLDQAHGQCLRGFVECCQEPEFPAIVVDNTNTQLWEMAPYATLARAYGHALELHVFMNGSAETFAERNAHGVPLQTITRQWHQTALTLENGLGVEWEEIQARLAGCDRSGYGALFPRTFRPFQTPTYFH